MLKIPVDGGDWLVEKWRGHYNTVRPHSSSGFRPPAPEAWQAESKVGHGKVESKKRFQLFHTPDYDGGPIN
jgi:putative transposase